MNYWNETKVYLEINFAHYVISETFEQGCTDIQMKDGESIRFSLKKQRRVVRILQTV